MSPAPAAIASPGTFVEVTEQAGIRFRHENGAFGAKNLPETMGSGVAVFDFDGDGKQDLYFVNFLPWPGHETKPLPTGALFRNLGDWHFEDVTKASGLAVPIAGMGVAAGDMDSDHDMDLFVSCLGPDHLFRNDGGKFTDVTKAAGLSDDDFGSSATWVDIDRDGDLDLFVANYVSWTLAGDIRCTLDGVNKSYCTPESYAGASPRLWRNEGGGRFIDGTQAAGLVDPTCKALGVIAADVDGDGWQDIVVANDTQPNSLFRNKGNGTFADEGIRSGIAYDENGIARAGMGIDAADYDGSGRPSIVIGNFSNEMLGLYHSEGKGLFIDMAPSSTVGRASLLTLAFTCLFLDFDLDGHEDLFVVNGHLDPEIERVQPQVKHAQPPHLFRNRGGGAFDEVTSLVGADLPKPKIGRGGAFGDLDGDGDLDLVVTENGGPAHVYRNDRAGANHWLVVDVPVLGAVVRVESGGRTQAKAVKGSSGYLSQSQMALTFGLGATSEATARVEITWPSGAVRPFEAVDVDRRIRIEP